MDGYQTTITMILSKPDVERFDRLELLLERVLKKLDTEGDSNMPLPDQRCSICGNTAVIFNAGVAGILVASPCPSCVKVNADTEAP